MSKGVAAALERARNKHLDDDALQEKVFIRLLSSPLTLLPFLGGFTALLGMWVLGLGSGLAVFGALSAIMLSAGTFVTRLLLGSEAAVADARKALEIEARREREAALDELEAKLAQDGDPRTERALRDLRALADTFLDLSRSNPNFGLGATFDIASKVDELFIHSVLSLERSVNLWYSAMNLQKAAAKGPILERREELILDVEQSIEKLGTILADIQVAGIRLDEQESGLARIRGELDQSLDVARAVEKRMKAMNAELKGVPDGGHGD